MTLSSGGVTRPGQVVQIRGEGMPIYGRAGARGDLWVTYTVDFPAALSEAQRAAVRGAFGGAAKAGGGQQEL